MRVFRQFKSYAANEDGAVTVDWVVLTAAVVGLGVAALAAVRTGTESLTSRISTYLSGVSIDDN